MTGFIRHSRIVTTVNCYGELFRWPLTLIMALGLKNAVPAWSSAREERHQLKVSLEMDENIVMLH